MIKLLRWYDAHGRRLPWRGTTDAYAILVSEMMLQQTQVERVKGFYADWLRRFPDWKTLAQAANGQVIRAWAGLGYNRRALALRDIARQIVERGLPQTEEAWRSLKGVGPYTAAAMSCFSLHERRLPIDTNIRRAAGRLWLGKPFPQPADDVRIQRAAQRPLAGQKRFFDIPQALFDLASMICTKNPSCRLCPMRMNCSAAKKFLSGRVRIPKAMIIKAKESRQRGKPHPDRIYRGRILRLVREHASVAIRTVGKRVDPSFDPVQDGAWMLAMIERLKKDRLIVQHLQSILLDRL